MLEKLTNLTTKVFTAVFGHSKPILKPSAPAVLKMTEQIIKSTKYDGRSKKRQWEDRRSDKGEGLLPPTKQTKTENDTSEISDTFDRIKRRKFVLLMGYSGVDYFGMQRNPNTKTIEEDLFSALLKAKLINDECYNQVQNMQFQRAARTDKGVSAARQVVSLKLAETVDLETINNNLPEVIRVFAFKRVTKGFNSKSQCDSRTYIYVLPTICFVTDPEIKQSDFRATEDLINSVNEVLQNFVGTKNFHNFTSKKKPTDPSTNRYMKSFNCEKPFVRNGVEFAVLKVQGQSFMMHQIRKMVGLTLAVVRGLAGKDVFTLAFSMEKMNIPRAPGLGLVLDYVHYDRYNFRYGSDGLHETLTWEDVETDVNNFKEKYIFPTIINTEIQEENMKQWIESRLSRHSYTATDDDEKNSDDESEEPLIKITEEKKVTISNVST